MISENLKPPIQFFLRGLNPMKISISVFDSHSSVGGGEVREPLNFFFGSDPAMEGAVSSLFCARDNILDRARKSLRRKFYIKCAA